MNTKLSLEDFKELKSQQNEYDKINLIKQRHDQVTMCYKENLEVLKKLIIEKKELERQLQSDVMPAIQYLLDEKLRWWQELKNVENQMPGDVSQNLENMCSCLGFQLTDFCKSEQSTDCQLSLRYSNYNCYLKFKAGSSYELLDIQPMHPNFKEIQEFLNKTQDVQGFLRNLRKFFDFIINLQKKNTTGANE